MIVNPGDVIKDLAGNNYEVVKVTASTYQTHSAKVPLVLDVLMNGKPGYTLRSATVEAMIAEERAEIWPGGKPPRAVGEVDIVSAGRGLQMRSMTLTKLRSTRDTHARIGLFASRAIVAAVNAEIERRRK